MGTKDKGGKGTKKPAAKNLKEKRLEKKSKRAAAAKSTTTAWAGDLRLGSIRSA